MTILYHLINYSSIVNNKIIFKIYTGHLFNCNNLLSKGQEDYHKNAKRLPKKEGLQA